jgi:hypothetical protein
MSLSMIHGLTCVLCGIGRKVSHQVGLGSIRLAHIVQTAPGVQSGDI